jgi:ATP-dependent Lon protease
MGIWRFASANSRMPIFIWNSMMSQIPIFPLDLVVFPGTTYPLHIFEERYKAMIGLCLADDSHFAIHLKSTGILHPIGTVVDVTLLRRYEDGRMDILVKGLYRHKISGMNTRTTPYYLADSMVYEDNDDEEVNVSALMECLDLYNRVVLAIPDLKAKRYSIEDILEMTLMPSFIFATKSGLNIQQKQELLEMKSEMQRIEMLTEILSLVVPKLEDIANIERIIMSDGYFPSIK